MSNKTPEEITAAVMAECERLCPRWGIENAYYFPEYDGLISIWKLGGKHAAFGIHIFGEEWVINSEILENRPEKSMLYYRLLGIEARDAMDAARFDRRKQFMDEVDAKITRVLESSNPQTKETGLLHAEILSQMDTSPAPESWKSISVIAAGRPPIGDEDHVSLHELDQARGICVWLTKRTHEWTIASGFFKVDAYAAAGVAKANTMNSDVVAALEYAIELEEKRLQRERHAADVHNNSDGVGISYEYASYPEPAKWLETAKKAIKIQKGETT